MANQNILLGKLLNRFNEMCKLQRWCAIHIIIVSFSSALTTSLWLHVSDNEIDVANDSLFSIESNQFHTWKHHTGFWSGARGLCVYLASWAERTLLLPIQPYDRWLEFRSDCMHPFSPTRTYSIFHHTSAYQLTYNNFGRLVRSSKRFGVASFDSTADEFAEIMCGRIQHFWIECSRIGTIHRLEARSST